MNEQSISEKEKLLSNINNNEISEKEDLIKHLENEKNNILEILSQYKNDKKNDIIVPLFLSLAIISTIIVLLCSEFIFYGGVLIIISLMNIICHKKIVNFIKGYEDNLIVLEKKINDEQEKLFQMKNVKSKNYENIEKSKLNYNIGNNKIRLEKYSKLPFFKDDIYKFQPLCQDEKRRVKVKSKINK